MEITGAKTTNNSNRNDDAIEIYFEGTLHLQFYLKDYIGMQSWIMNDDKFKFKIELTFKTDTTILVEYDNIEKWKSVLNLIQTLLNEHRESKKSVKFEVVDTRTVIKKS